MPTDRHYTGQENDATELLYYGARYYDPRTGQFMSPDTIVPNPDNVFDYNRYLYVRGNPLKYNDPSGHCVTTAPAGPAGIPLDALCWAAIGKAVAASAASAAAAAAAAAAAPVIAFSAGGAIIVGGGMYMIAVADPSIPTYMPTIPPAIKDIQETFPLGNTVGIGSTGIPLGVVDPTGVSGGNALPAGAIPNILADPLGQGIDSSPYLWRGENARGFHTKNGFSRATSDMSGGLSGAEEYYEKVTGTSLPNGYDTSSKLPVAGVTDVAKYISVFLRPTSATGTPVVEIVDLKGKTHENIHFNP